MDKGCSLLILAFATGIFFVPAAGVAFSRLAVICFSLLAFIVLGVFYCIQKSFGQPRSALSCKTTRSTDTLEADCLSRILERVKMICSSALLSVDQPFALTDRHVLITGGSKGVGLSIALACIRRRPALLSLIARTPAGLKEAQRSCISEASQKGISVAVQTVQADLSDITTVEGALRRAMYLQVLYNEDAGGNTLCYCLALSEKDSSPSGTPVCFSHMKPELRLAILSLRHQPSQHGLHFLLDALPTILCFTGRYCLLRRRQRGQRQKNCIRQNGWRGHQRGLAY